MAGSGQGAGASILKRYSITADQALLALVAMNLLVTTGDVVIAHAFNDFALSTQYLPFAVGGLAGLAVAFAVPGVAVGWRRALAGVGLWMCIGLGLLGFVLHVEAQVVWRGLLSLKAFVYAAPLVAPLAYAGTSLIGLVVLSRRDAFVGWDKRRLLCLLVAAGSAGNAVLAALDHARNAFISPVEWLPIPVSLFAASAFAWAAFRDSDGRIERGTLWAVVAVQIAVGLLGWGYHVIANLSAPTGGLLHRIIYGPPLFSPLLMANVATFGAVLLVLRFRHEAAPVTSTEDAG